MRSTKNIAYFVLTTTVLFSCQAWAIDGLEVPSIGAIQAGTAGAGVANAHDSTWMMMNPASISSLGEEFDYSAEIAKPEASTDVHGINGLTNKAGTQDSSIWQVIPAVSYVKPLEVGTLGIGMFGTSGVATNYNQAITSYGQAGDFNKKINYELIQNVLSYAYPLDNSFSLGAGLHLNYARFKSDMIDVNTLSETPGHDQWESSVGGGLQLGATKSLADNLKLGISYSFEQPMQKFDHYTDVLPYALDVPASAQAGVSYNIRPDLELVTDYKWIDWSGDKAFGKNPAYGGLGWKSQSIIMAGGTYTANEQWKVRAGLSYGNSPIDDQNAFVNAQIPVVTTAHVTLGGSYALSSTTSINFAYIHAFNNSVTDNGTGGTLSQLGQGTKDALSVNSIVIGSSIKF